MAQNPQKAIIILHTFGVQVAVFFAERGTSGRVLSALHVL